MGQPAKVELRLLPDGPSFAARAGDTALDAALDAGVEIQHECGGNCSCTTCHIIVEEGWTCLSPIEEPEEYRLGFAEDRTTRSRLACQALLLGGPISFRIP